MAESTAIFHKYGGVENLLAVNTKGRSEIYVNMAEIWRYGDLETKKMDLSL